jgi:hypothetical protein
MPRFGSESSTVSPDRAQNAIVHVHGTWVGARSHDSVPNVGLGDQVADVVGVINTLDLTEKPLPSPREESSRVAWSRSRVAAACRSDPTWRYEELPGPHFLMMSPPRKSPRPSPIAEAENQRSVAPVPLASLCHPRPASVPLCKLLNFTKSTKLFERPERSTASA